MKKILIIGLVAAVGYASFKLNKLSSTKSKDRYKDYRENQNES